MHGAMLRVLAITTLFPNTAQPVFATFVEGSLLRLGARADVDLTVVAPLGVPPWPLDRVGDYAKFAGVPLSEMWKGVRVHRPRFPVIPRVGWRVNAALVARAATPFVKAGRYDVIQADFFFPDGVAAAALGARAGLPVSIKARGSDIQLWGRKPQLKQAMVAAASQAAGLLAVSQSLKAQMVELGMPAEKIAVHYTGVELERFRPVDRAAARAELGLPAPLVLSVGHLIARKRFDVVIRAMAALPHAHLRIVGDGPERGRLQALIAELGLGARVELMGARPHAEVARLLAAADVLALASEREGLANVWVEALACGTPIVITPIEGSAETIDRAAAGRIVRREPAAFAEAIGALLADPPPQEAVRAAVSGRFGWERHTDELFGHLQQLAGRG